MEILEHLRELSSFLKLFPKHRPTLLQNLEKKAEI